MAAKTIEYEDKGLEDLATRLGVLKKMRLKVGYQKPEGGTKYGSGIKVAKLAAVMEFGGLIVGGKHGGGTFHTGSSGKSRKHKWGGTSMPARSFMRSTIEEKAAEIEACEMREIRKVIAGEKTPLEAMSAIGSYVVGLIRNKLRSASTWATPLSAATVAAKGSSTPLRETDLLMHSLSWQVNMGRGVLARGNR